ncbi:hypothetical protein AVEN_101675-1 [Araneus ventricosus]|uniref:Uncharacterized protein n=1 Tax=Araneus ventricosus TaxID=182803 RepID=A0A4Y2L984_ARAVE|nr:hypothetical protein AVEN_101675-1 [Araneus ventricosus]
MHSMLFYCFRHAGFKAQPGTESTAEIIDQVIEDENFDEEEEMLREISKKMKLDENLSFDEYSTIDYGLVCVENLSENELIYRYCAQEEIASSSDEENEEIVPKLPRIKKMFQVLLRL